MEQKNNIFTSLFKVFLNKYFLPEVTSLDQNMKLSQSQSTEGSRPGASVGKGEPSHDRMHRLIKEVNNFFFFLGFLSVEYYCLDRLVFSGLNDMGFKIKVDPCVYLTREIMADFFVFILYEKYMSSNIVELLQRKNASELDTLVNKYYQLKDVGYTELKIPLEAFPDYSVLQTLINNSLDTKRHGVTGGHSKTILSNPNTFEVAEPGAISSSLSSDPKPVKEFTDLLASGPKLESEMLKLEKTEKISFTSRVSIASSNANEKLKGDLLSHRSSSHVRASSANNSFIMGLCLRHKLHIKERSRIILDETKMFTTVLSDSGMAHNKLHQAPATQVTPQRPSRGNKRKLKSARLLSTLEVLTLDDQLTILDILNNRGASRPFTQAISIFKHIQFIESPLAKLECIYSCLSEAIRDVRDYYATVNRSIQNFFLLSKDNLQSIFTYIAIHARVASLPLQLLVIREFIISRGLIDTERVCQLITGTLKFIEKADCSG